MASSFKGAHVPQDSSLMGVRWYVAYPLSYRQVEERMEERGVPVDHVTIQRWVVQYSPLLEEAFHRRKRLVWGSWRLDETSMRVKGEWRYRYRAMDKYGETIDFLLTEHQATMPAGTAKRDIGEIAVRCRAALHTPSTPSQDLHARKPQEAKIARPLGRYCQDNALRADYSS